MKKYFALLALLAIPAAASAQDVTVSATVNAQRTIVTETGRGTLNLGSGNPGATLTVAPNNAGAGVARAEFNAGSTVSFSVPTPVTGLTVAYNCSYDTVLAHTNYNAAADASSNDSGNFQGANCGTAKTFTVSTAALTRYIFVGASTTIPTDALAGTYTGTVRFTIAP